MCKDDLMCLGLQRVFYVSLRLQNLERFVQELEVVNPGLDFRIKQEENTLGYRD